MKYNLGDKVYYKHPNGKKYLCKIAMINKGNSVYVVFPIDIIPNTNGHTSILDPNNCDRYLQNSAYLTDPAIRTTPHYDRFIDEVQLVLASESATVCPESIKNGLEIEEDHGGLHLI
jgi:hypothetical protein